MSLDRTLDTKLQNWLDGEGFSPGHFIVDREYRAELALGTILADVLALGTADEDDAGTDLISVNDTGSVFAGTTLSAVLLELYNAATSASSDTFTDSNAYYALDQVGPAFDALGVQIGGDTATTFAFTAPYKVANDDTVYAAIDKLDIALQELNQGGVPGQGAALVGINPALGGGYWAGTSAQNGLDELATAIGGTNSTTRNYSSNGYVLDDDDIVVAIGKLDAGAVLAQADATSAIAAAAAAQADATTALARVGEVHVICDLTLGAEVANVVPVTVNLVDEDGAAVARVQRLLCQVFSADMTQNAAVFRLAETGVGVEVSTTAMASLVIDTDANGDAILGVTDVAGASGLIAWLLVTPISTATTLPGSPRLIPVGFDGV